MTQLKSHSFFCSPPRWGGKTSCGTSSAQKARSRFCKGKISPRICKGGATLGMWCFFLGRRRCTGMICKGCLDSKEYIDARGEVERSLLMVGRQCICHLEDLQNHGISFSKHPFKAPKFPGPKTSIYTQIQYGNTWDPRRPLQKQRLVTGGFHGSSKYPKRYPVDEAPQRVVWLHHHSLANWDSNIRSSSEFDHNGLETEARTVGCFFCQKIGPGDEYKQTYNENKKTDGKEI